MVVLTPRFTLLAALSSIAAISLVPAPVDAAAIQALSQEAIRQPIVARHSSHGHGDGENDGRKHSASPGSDARVAATKKDSSDSKPQRHPKPVVPLPARMAQKSAHKASPKKASKAAESGSRESKHEKSKRLVWGSDPVSRMERLWLGPREVTARGMPLRRLEGRHHHHDHHDHHDKVVVDGDNDHVDVHHRSVDGLRVARAPHDAHDRVLVEGHNDHVHVHDHDAHDDHDRVVVKGDNDHVHVRRSPSPHHHHDHDEVVVKGNHDSVHVHRSPAPHHHHHHHQDTVVVKGDDDHVNVHRRSPVPRHRHRHKVVVKGDNQHVHVGRSPTPEPEPHRHHHHGFDKVVVTGDDDHVKVHERSLRQPIMVISGNQGATYLVHHRPAQDVSNTDSGLLGLKLNLRRDGQPEGVPGSIQIMVSPMLANSTVGERIASLVLAEASNTTAVNNASSSAFVLNASGSNSTQMYMVPAAAAEDSPSSNLPSIAPASSVSFIKVALQIPSYCATFDPQCIPGYSNDDHKSQVFAYEPSTGAIRPMWYEGQDDESGDGGEDAGSAGAVNPADVEDDDDELDGVGATTVDPTTPASSKFVNVTSFEQEALDQQYGDATRPPARLAEAQSFAATETPPGGQAVTLVFSPAAPEKVAVPQSSSETLASSATPDSDITGTSAVSTATMSSMAALEVTQTSSDTATSSSTGSLSATSSAAASVTSTSPDAVTSSAVATTSASSSASPALEVKVFNPYAQSTSSNGAASSATASESASSATMTPVSTAPYEWMFKQSTSLADLD
ncbi:hypothetical protein C8Q77DRAFT_1219702 [Trametes polyzona]|nr:hypothetical protein C8Q77DRAFT_1219702 [Trametes polyzona]